MPFVLRETNEHPLSHLFLHHKVETLRDVGIGLNCQGSDFQEQSRHANELLILSPLPTLTSSWRSNLSLNLFGRWVISRYSKLIKKGLEILISLTTRKPQKVLSAVKIEKLATTPSLVYPIRVSFFLEQFSLFFQLCMTHFYESRFHHSFLFTFYS